MASSAPTAATAWRNAQKLRKLLARDIGKLMPPNVSGVDLSKFEAIDNLLDKFRLACVATIFHDLDYAIAQKTEEHLWSMHTTVNTEYRHILSRLKQSSHAVEKRKVEKMYHNFLRIAAKFYQGYVQRLAAYYDIPELERIAQGMELEKLSVETKISPVSDDLQRKILYSCHLTLIHLGDLTRYRVQARHKSSDYEGALVYYGLAHHIQPQSGFAFHQTGIIHLEQDNHLEVVYNFYRALAVDSPHPNAQLNLEAEFKTMLSPSGSRSRHNISGPEAHFTMWFVKLHAFFYKGEVFHQQDELEGEVMHRLEMACRNAASLNILLKMAMVNMLAHHMATTRYTEKQTETTMRFYQFTLRFNAKFLHTFCKVFESEFREAVSSAEGLDHQPDDAETGQEKTSVVEALLPVLRIYSMWLVARRNEISGLADAFGAAIPTMIQSVAKVLTLLCDEYYNLGNLKSCPYLLPEDIQILGFQPLNEEQLPEYCKAYCGEDGTRKPYSQALGGCLSQSSERIGRILDILRCAYFLANEGAFPLIYRVDGTLLVFEYQPNAGLPQVQPREAQDIADTTQLVGDLPATEEATTQTEVNSREQATANVVQYSEQAQREASRRLLNNSDDIYEDSEVMDRATETVLDMVVQFLRPPTPMDLERSPKESASTNDVVGSLRTEPSPTSSIASRRYESLPWSWFGTPNPHASRDSVPPVSRDTQNNHRSATHSPNASVAENIPLEDPFITPGRDISRNIANGMGSPADTAAGTFHREQLLQAFGGSASTPRTSSFSRWSQNPTVTAIMQEPQNYGAVLTSSNTSTFSHPSSLYQGTQLNGLQYNLQSAVDPSRILRNTHLRETNQPHNGQFQIQQTTSNYDRAVMELAYQGSR
ncbi:uncharacterized protein TRIVIDRAFT_189958 [Trichoderma virens Gv29-8]|uniref:Nonsense-mediated mRNA decay factor n=1 Tax=Hypocrea virens (strain Gv29-8 / FGSC 10586) TaxID=413071 RepID=G9MMX0_HYPVG|nr:uncharacterized protein TRIVIDRAFT_189958 [Trichoderma virens Gv29-8]EHK24688.1 hypothetical protein TRIVIDRAFT_189958 [Trichoderma virens Gv29-8]UKZ54952.1 hypothetical protein TrVGV298_008767 [Trichoderma virens]